MKKFWVRMGDGFLAEVSETEIRKDIEEGTRDASERAGVPPLSEDERKHLFDIYSSSAKFTSVEIGNEVILTYDAGTLKIRRVGAVPVMDHPPTDAVSRASKAMVEICRLDGL